MKQFFLISLLIFGSIGLFGQINIKDSIRPDATIKAFQEISKQETSKSGVVNFHQDKRIEKLVIENITSPTSAVVHGFRVQVFSSNAHRTAREEAFNLEHKLMEAFPEMKVYVSYTSPFWKVRVGDFFAQDEARIFSEELLRRFPTLRKETYTVRDRISVSEK